MVHRSLSGKKIQLKPKKGRSSWVEVKTLGKKDQEYAEKWVKEDDHVSVKLIGAEGSKKHLDITLQGGSYGVKVLIERRGYTKKITRFVKAGATANVKIWSGKNYSVKAFRGSEMVDQETHFKKSGFGS